MFDRTTVEKFKAIVAKAGLSLSDFDLHLETAATCGETSPAGDPVFKVRYRPSGVEKHYPEDKGPAWVDRFADDLEGDLFLKSS
jgi:hypothetical protein